MGALPACGGKPALDAFLAGGSRQGRGERLMVVIEAAVLQVSWLRPSRLGLSVSPVTARDPVLEFAPPLLRAARSSTSVPSPRGQADLLGASEAPLRVKIRFVPVLGVGRALRCHGHRLGQPAEGGLIVRPMQHRRCGGQHRRQANHLGFGERPWSSRRPCPGSCFR
jgi:hypothetical protein